LNPKEVERQVIAIRFDQNDQVASLGQYGLEDGKIVDINSRTTPTKGRELTMLQQLFGNIGKPGPGGAIVPGRTPGSTAPASLARKSRQRERLASGAKRRSSLRTK
jgi:hypothetical protein